ncbi:DUF3368 domain-containing protein [Leucothrix mucor]|uniref:DUF3368 domain-containing protein n=1 Tax=Leucothrix mucor TaxID=45248 RepID=UPI000A0439D4
MPSLKQTLLKSGFRSIRLNEAKGRKIARQLSLDMMGSAGVIATAKRLGLIEQAKPLLLRLSESGYYLSSTVVDMAPQDHKS